jgi:hypothetical protein
METPDVPQRNIAKIDEKITGDYTSPTWLGENSGSSLARFLASTMTFVGCLYLVIGTISGIFFVVQNDDYLDGYGFFDSHPYSILGISVISSSIAIGLPIAALGSYMSARLRLIKN